MGGRRDTHHRCEGRRLRWQSVVGGDVRPFPLCRGGEAASAASECEHHALQHEPEPQKAPRREVTMMVYRNGQLWEASADVPLEGEGSIVWMAYAIAALDTSVDMAISDEAV